MNNTVSTKIYASTLAATLIIFIGALLVSGYINQRKINELRAIEDKVALDILSLETQYDLINTTTCETYDKSSLSRQLDELHQRLIFMEDQLGVNNPDVSSLKRYYSLLEIKDYMLAKKMSDECGRPHVFVLYFYTNGNCEKCLTQEYMLRAVQGKYPRVKIYTFDYALDLPAVQTLISMHDVPSNPPVLNIQGKVYPGFSTLEELEAVIDSHLATSSIQVSVNR